MRLLRCYGASIVRRLSTEVRPICSLLPIESTKQLRKREGEPPRVPPLAHLPWQMDTSNVLPSHEQVYLSLTGFDYGVLERWHRYANRLCLRLSLDVHESLAMPKRSWSAALFKPRTEQEEESHEYSIYERVLILHNAHDSTLGHLSDLLTASAPEGCRLGLGPYDEEEYNRRYMPNVELRLLLEEVAGFDTLAVRRKKGWTTD